MQVGRVSTNEHRRAVWGTQGLPGHRTGTHQHILSGLLIRPALPKPYMSMLELPHAAAAGEQE